MQKLLILHGALGSASQMRKLADSLESNFEVHTMDFSGHGEENMPDVFSIKNFADDIINYLDENKIDAINVFGYSMGGYAALYAAARTPERFSKIFTLATKFDWNKETSAKEVKMLDVNKIVEKVPAFAKDLQARHGEDNWKNVLKVTAEMMIALGEKPELQDDDFEKVTCAVFLSVGDRDTMVSVEETMNVYKKIKGAAFSVLPYTQHPIEKIDTERIKYELVKFFGA